ncbi:hypothetical protein [Paracoccus yeei]|nr:hypothetical protein [Paracoccus yeei]
MKRFFRVGDVLREMAVTRGLAQNLIDAVELVGRTLYPFWLL